jgi:molecular chaperone Hsp33
MTDNNDIVKRIYCRKLNVRAYAVSSLNTVRKITEIHQTTPNATYALGRTINAAALLAATLKPDSNQNVTVKLSGSGPLKEIHVQADARCFIRGFVANPSVDLMEDIGKISFSKSIGAGMLTITKDLGLKEPYTTIQPLLAGEIATEIAYYLASSEQIPSAMILGMNINSYGVITTSGGILIQSYPDTDKSVIENLEKNILAMKKPLSEMLEKIEIIDALKYILDTDEIEILSTCELKHYCRCSKDLILKIVKNFGNEEIDDMISKNHGAEIVCTFCKKNYILSEDELISLKN